MGAFTDWLITRFGTEKYLEFYKAKNAADELLHVYQKTAEELSTEFAAYIQLFHTNSAIEKRMEELLQK